jgi:Ca-activated chloride channel family protein
MRWELTQVLLYGIPAMLVVVGGSFWIARAVGSHRLARFINTRFLPELLANLNVRARTLKFAFYAMALLCMLLAIARPLVGPKDGELELGSGNLFIALDISKSMWTQDTEPTRIDNARNALADWTRTLAQDRISLIVFSGTAFPLAPLTTDYAAFRTVLNMADPRIAGRGSTNLEEPIRVAMKMAERRELRDAVLLIVSDGENLEGNPVQAARDAFSTLGMRIFCLGIGTSSGARVPSANPIQHQAAGQSASPPSVRGEFGSPVISRLDETSLRSIAAAGGGVYNDN